MKDCELRGYLVLFQYDQVITPLMFYYDIEMNTITSSLGENVKKNSTHCALIFKTRSNFDNYQTNIQLTTPNVEDGRMHRTLRGQMA